MRSDPRRLHFEIAACQGSARAGVMATPRGPVTTPAFVPLATMGSVRSLSAADVRALGYEMVLGNTYHLMLRPGEERVHEMGGLGAFMGWSGATITDSGGFQVFSLAHGSVADEVKGRRGRMEGKHRVLGIDERGVRFKSHIDGAEHLLSPERSMEVQARLGADIVLAFDECTPFHVDREYTLASTERTHRWLDRCASWHEEHAPGDQALFGIVQGGTQPDLRRESAEYVARSAVDGTAIGGTLGRDKEEMLSVLDRTLPHVPWRHPRHLLGIGEPDDLIEGIRRGVDTFDCAVPTRLARHGMALAPLPERRFRFDVRRAAHAGEDEPLVEDCDCEACGRHSRAYLHHLSRSGELTAVRLLTIHNLTYVMRLVAEARTAILEDRFEAYAAAILGGSSPFSAGA